MKILNQGTYYWDGGKPADITSTDAKVVNDEDGNPLGLVRLTKTGDINTTDVPTFTEFKVYREQNFTSLGII